MKELALALIAFLMTTSATAQTLYTDPATGDVGVGTSTITNKFEVNGSASIGYPDISAPTNGLIVQGRVGLGTSGVPVVAGDLLDIFTSTATTNVLVRATSTTRNSSFIADSNSGFGSQLIFDNTNIEEGRIGYDNTTNSLRINTNEAGVANSNERMRIDSSGHVGIATTAPQSLLQVYNGEVQVGTSGAACSVANAGALRYSGGSAYVCDSANWDVFGGSAGGTLPALSSGKIWVGNGSNVATAQALSGDCTISNVGGITCTKTNGTSFGTLATQYAVSLSTQATGILQAAQFPVLYGDVTTTAGSTATTIVAIQSKTVSGTTGTGNVVFSASPTLTGTLSAGSSIWNGAVGIGTTSPAKSLDINVGTAAPNAAGILVQGDSYPTGDIGLVLKNNGPGGNYWEFDSTSNNSGNGGGKLVIVENGSLPAMTIGSSGNVGIGTIAPSNPLSVSGIIQSLSGGFKFPDGTTQTTAATSGGVALRQVFTSSGTWTKPGGLTSNSLSWVQCWGGGGSGGNSGVYGEGGGGGAYDEAYLLTSTFGSTETVTVGSGGSGGSAGGNSTFGSHLTVYGGAALGAGGGTLSAGSGSTGGAPGGGTSSNLDSSMGGGGAWTSNGGNSFYGGGGAGCGGGCAAGKSVWGGGGGAGNGDTPGSSVFGGAGGANGSNGAQPGGGGGGFSAGGAGECIVTTWY